MLKLARAGLLGEPHVLLFLRLKEEEGMGLPRWRQQNFFPNLTLCYFFAGADVAASSVGATMTADREENPSEGHR